MTATCPHPLANPFNIQRFTNFRIADACNGHYLKTSKSVELPDSTVSYEQLRDYQESLHVPDSLTYTGNGTGADDDTITCPDGTVLSFKDRKIIEKVSIDRSRDFTPEALGTTTWSADKSFDWSTLSLLEQPDSNLELTKADLQYWEYADMMSKKLSANMNMEQVMLLAELSGHGFFDSKLVEVDD